MNETTTLDVVIAGKDQFSATANKVSGSLKNLEKTAGAIGGHLSSGLRTAGQNIERLSMAAAGLAVGAGALAVKWAGDFEAQLNTINTIAFATPEGLKKIGDEIRAIAKTTGISTDDLTGSYYDLLSAGVKVADAQSLLNNAVTLGIGGLATTKQTVDLLTTAYNAYGLTAKQTTQATDMFAQAVADGKVTADQIAATFASVASIAKVAGIGINQIAASYGFLTAQGVPASEAMTEMQRVIISLMKPTGDLKDAQKALKVTFTDEVKKKGLVPALQELRDYSDKTKIPLISLLGRIEAVKYVLQTTGANEKGFTNELDNINNSAGMAAKQMAERQQGFNYQLAVLKANLHDAAITIGYELLPVLADLAKQFSDFLKGHQGDIKGFAKDLGQAFKDAVAWGKQLDWKAIGDSLKSAVGFAKGIVDAFMNAPTWLQEAVVTGWGLNKLTGGAVTNIFADVAKGIGQQFLQRGSSPANPLWVTSVGGAIPGAPGVPGGAKGPGLLGSIAGGAVVGLALDKAIDPNDPTHQDFLGKLGHGLIHEWGVAIRSVSSSPDDRQTASDTNKTALSRWAAQVVGDFGRIDVAGQKFQHGIKDVATTLSAAAQKMYDHLAADWKWAHGLPKGIHDRSVAKFGGTGLGKSAENATYQRDILGKAASIMRHGKDSADRLERLKQLMRDAKLATDATKNKLSADIKILAASIHKQPILVNVQATTNVLLNQRKVGQVTASTVAYGKTVAGGRIYEP